MTYLILFIILGMMVLAYMIGTLGRIVKLILKQTEILGDYNVRYANAFSTNIKDLNDRIRELEK